MPDPFTDEDRARLEALGQYVDCEVALRALAHIEELEAALGAADELARVSMEYWGEDDPGHVVPLAVDAYRSARASMREDAG